MNKKVEKRKNQNKNKNTNEEGRKYENGKWKRKHKIYKEKQK